MRPLLARNRPAFTFAAALALVAALVGSSGAATGTSVFTMSPADGATIAGQVRWEAGVTGPLPTKIDFLVDGQYKWTEKNPPYVYHGNTDTWDSRKFPDGPHSLTVKAYAVDGTTSVSTVLVTVRNGGSTGGGALTLMTTSPTNGATVTGSVRWEVTPSSTVSKIEFSVDGAMRWTERGAPYVFNGNTGLWDTTKETNGTHILSARAFTSDGRTATATTTVVVANGGGGGGGGDTSAPTPPSALAETDATETSVSLTWKAGTDNVGVKEYAVYRDAAFAGTTGGTSYTVTGLTCGKAYTIGVEARDAAGNVSGRPTLTAATDDCSGGGGGGGGAGSTLYVDRESRGGSCSDGRSAAEASSAGKPWCSLARALAAAPGGSVVLVRGGSYPELSVKDDNRRSSMLTLKAYTGESVTLNGFDVSKASHVRVEGFRITDWVDLTDGARQVALVGNDISPRGVRMKGVDGVLVEGNTIHDLVPDADGKCSCGIWIQSWGSIGPARNVTMRGNTITRLSNDGINLANVVNILIEGNTIKDALSIGNGAHVDSIHLMGGDNITLRGNRLEHNQHGLMFTDHQPRNVTIENNLVVGITNGMGMKTAGEEDMPNLKVINNTFYNNQLGRPVPRPAHKRDRAQQHLRPRRRPRQPTHRRAQPDRQTRKRQDLRHQRHPQSTPLRQHHQLGTRPRQPRHRRRHQHRRPQHRPPRTPPHATTPAFRT